MNALVEITHLSKIFSPQFPPALKEINASIPKGKMVGLVGPDGAGKTTLMRLMAALLLPTTGSITIDGKNTVEDAEEIHKITGYMPQKFGLYEDLSVVQNLELYADLKQVVGEEREKAFVKLLDFTGLKPFVDRLAGKLSGGMKQKLGLACALLKTPKLLLLDEPSVGVDPISRRELWTMTGELLGEGISVVWSTAYLDEAERCDTALLVNEGELLFSGDPKELAHRVEGRVFAIKGVSADHRGMLRKIVQQDNVIDGVIMGSDIRLIVKQPPKDNQILDQTIEPIPPRFEDAFIDILGGAPGAESKLALARPQIKKTAEDVIAVKEVTKKFGNFTAVNKVSFGVHKGEVFGLLGPNGAGKSTTFKMLCGLLHPTEGKAVVNGLDLEKAPSAVRQQIGYMAQKFSLYGNLNVMQNLAFFSGAYNLVGKEQKQAIEQMIDIFYLGDYLNVSAEILPLGFKQRLALACATMHKPEILFLDEPTSGVDPITRREFWNHINGLVEKGVTIMITTHFMDEAEYCDRIALIYQGEVIQLDDPEHLKAEVKSADNPNPSLEDAFIKLVEEHDRT